MVWIDEQAIKSWRCTEHHGRRVRGYIYSDVAIETALILKGVFNLSLRALEGFTNSICSAHGRTTELSELLVSEQRRFKLSIEQGVVVLWHML